LALAAVVAGFSLEMLDLQVVVAVVAVCLPAILLRQLLVIAL
jgi:hypothetical protein